MNELGNTPADKDYKPSGISRAEERALEAYPNEHFVDHTYAEMCRGFYEEGYEQAEKDILSKFTKEHLEGLKWIENASISTQPVPYHKYCKDLYKVLKELLKE